MGDSCANCRHVSKRLRPKVLEATGFDDQLMFDDEDETVFSCRAARGLYAGREVGPVPVDSSDCGAWEIGQSAKSDRLAELDRKIAEQMARFNARDGSE